MVSKAGIPTGQSQTDTVPISPSDITALMRITPPDSEDGWRLVARYPVDSCDDPRYRAAHRRSQRIRAGKVGYLRSLGQWDARAVKHKNECWLYLRFLGDGSRWTDD